MFVLPLLFACVGDSGDKTAGDDTGAAATGEDSAVVADPVTLSSFIDLSVNAASARFDSAAGLVLRTESGTNEPGGFNGGGVGNKSIAGAPGHDASPLGDLTGLALEGTPVSGTWEPYFNVIVDLDCTGETFRLVVADAPLATTTATAAGGTRYAFAASSPQWKAVGGLDDLLPSHLESTGGTLTSVVEAYPLACLRDASTGDGGLPAGVVTSAVLIILGDSANTAEAQFDALAVEIGPSRYE